MTVDELWEIAMCVVSIREKGYFHPDSVRRIIGVYHLGEKPRRYMLKVLAWCKLDDYKEKGLI